MEKPSVDTDRHATEKKRQQLAELLKKRAAQTAQDWPLSLGQERIYRLTQLTPDAPLYNVACAYRLTGTLDAAKLEAAVRRIETRHDILRTTFPTVGETPVQRVAPPCPDPGAGTFRRIDTEDTEAAITGEISRLLDLETGPLWRVALIREDDESHVLVLTMHHIVTDGWSFELFLRELAALYGAAVEGGEAEPAKPGMQYAEFGERQRRALKDPAVVAQQQYWRTQLAEPLAALALPADRPAGAGTERTAESYFFSLPEALSDDLNALSQGEGATLFMTMQVAFAALLNRATGQEEILLCAPVTGRHRAQSREILGYFNNILPIRLDLSGAPSLVELVRRSRQVTLDAYKNQDVPFQWNAALPGLRRIPLSRLLFSLDMEWPPRLALAGLAVAPLETETGAADFDLSVSLWLADGRIKGNLRYKTALFDRETIAAIKDAYEEILAAFVAAPDRGLDALPSFAIGTATDEGQAAEDVQVLPRSALEVRLAHLWEEALEKRPIGVRDHLVSLGASSLAVATLAESVQHEFETDLPMTAIFRAGTVERLATLLQSRDESLTRSPLAPIQPHGTRPPLFLCEGVGIYFPLVPYLGEDQPVFGLVSEIAADYPRVEDLAAHYLDSVLETQPEGPYHLGGVSFGGLVAFEMAQQLLAARHEVGLLALLDTPGPGAFRPKGRAGRALGHVGNVLRYGTPYVRKKLAGRLRKRSGGQAPHGSRLVADRDEVRRLFHKVATDYEIRPYDGRITLFALNERGGMTDSLFDPALSHIDPLLGWGNVARQGVDLYELDGEHVSILREPYVGSLGRSIRRLLEADEARMTPA